MPALPRAFLALPILSFLGLADALYLTAHHYVGIPLACGPFSGCGTVTSSSYSEIFGVPVALLGALYYAGIFFGSLLAWEYQSKTYARLVALATVAGLCTSLWFLFVMGILLQAWCTYCLISATTSALLFFAGMYARARLKNTDLPTPQTSAPVQ